MAGGAGGRLSLRSAMAPKDTFEITPELLLHAYASGVFPMSDGAEDDPLYWVDPQVRGILPLNGLHISRSLARLIRKNLYDIRLNSAFDQVVQACADRTETWINPEIKRLYSDLHQMGFAHSLEVFESDTLVGGVYGVTLGSAFFGESMFSRRPSASKIALAYLVDQLRNAGFTLFDTQFTTDHLLSLGAVDISRDSYRQRLATALNRQADITLQPSDVSPSGIIQRNTQTS